MPIADRGSDIYTAIRNDTPLAAVAITGTLRVLYVCEYEEPVADLIDAAGARRPWEVTHAQNKDEAFEIAHKQPVDVAVLNTNLPDADVVAVAGELARIHSKLTVFVITENAAEQAAGARVSGRYQWLSRPCEAMALVTGIERMATLVSWLTNNTTLALVSGIHSLPAIPSNYRGVIRIIHSPTVAAQEIGEAINRDMGMTSRVLQVANSAYYGYTKKITNPTEAVLFLGVETVKSLIHYSHMLNNFPQLAAADFLFERVWKHSMGVAGVARKITLLETGDEALAEEAFTAGLLHDIGKLVLMSVRPEEYRAVMRLAAEKKGAPHMIERLKLQTTHAETGAYLLSLWGIPYTILEAVAWHHYPSEASGRRFSPLTAVHAANVFEHQREDSENVKHAPALDYRYLAEVGVSDRIEEWRRCKPDIPNRLGNIPVSPYQIQRTPAAPQPASPPPVAKSSGWVFAAIAALAVLLFWYLLS